MLEGERKDRWQTFIIASLHRFGSPSPTVRRIHHFGLWLNGIMIKQWREAICGASEHHLEAHFAPETDTSGTCRTEERNSAASHLLSRSPPTPHSQEHSPLSVGAFSCTGQAQSESYNLKLCVCQSR